jgi:hypothetical protein
MPRRWLPQQQGRQRGQSTMQPSAWTCQPLSAAFAHRVPVVPVAATSAHMTDLRVMHACVRACVRVLARIQACCCGATEPASSRTDPFLGQCGEDTYGSYTVTGASAGSCPECKMGLGAFSSVSIQRTRAGRQDVDAPAACLPQGRRRRTLLVSGSSTQLAARLPTNGN